MDEYSIKARLAEIEQITALLNREARKVAGTRSSAAGVARGSARSSESVRRLLGGSAQGIDGEMLSSLDRTDVAARRFLADIDGIAAGISDVNKNLSRERDRLRAELEEIRRRQAAAEAAARAARR